MTDRPRSPHRLAFAALLAVCPALLASSDLTPAHREAYDTPDRAGFESFLDATPGNRADYEAFVELLVAEGVAGVVPAWELWRQGTDWRIVGEDPFAIPPREQWAAIVPTLVVLRDEVVPRIGAVEVVSGWRTEPFNRKAGGASRSRHRWFEAVDVVPAVPWRREALHGVLLGWWEADGGGLGLGLGLYEKIRFHVDTHAYRKW